MLQAALAATAEATLRAAMRQSGITTHHYHRYARRYAEQQRRAKMEWLQQVQADYDLKFGVKPRISDIARLSGIRF